MALLGVKTQELELPYNGAPPFCIGWKSEVTVPYDASHP